MAHLAARAICCEVGPGIFSSLHSWSAYLSCHWSRELETPFLFGTSASKTSTLVHVDGRIRLLHWTSPTVQDTLSRQPVSDLPNSEDSYGPENGVLSFLVVVMSADVPHHTPTLVSETLNGHFAFLRHVCLLTHSTVHPAASTPVEGSFCWDQWKWLLTCSCRT